MTLPIEQWRRRFKVQVGGIEIASDGADYTLRTIFSVERDKRREPNNAELAIYNLNPSHRAELEQEENVPVRIEAGYEEAASQIFFGVLRKAESFKDGGDWVTRVSAGDGEDKYKARYISKSFAEGTPMKAVLAALVKALGLGEGNLADVPPTVSSLAFGSKLVKPLTLNGPAAEELQAITRTIGYEWSIQDGSFQVTKIGKPVGGTAGPKLAPSSGLVGSPRIDSKGFVIVRALLLPDLLPAYPFRVESAAIEGDFVAERTRHFGDSESTEWYVDVKGKPL